MNFTPDSEVVEAATETFNNAESIFGMLEAVGTLVACGAPIPHVNGGVLDRRVRQEIERWEADDLFGVITETILRQAEAASNPENQEAIDEVIVALDRRDSVELRLLGVETLLGDVLLEDQRARFAEQIGPVLWQLVPLNSTRSARVSWMRPEVRGRFWWWSRGMNLPSDVLNTMGEVATMLAIFPGVEPTFQGLRRAAVMIGG